MAIEVTFPDGTKQIIKAVRVENNYHEGMYDFYDESGWLADQIGLGEQITWQLIDESQQ